ncbi:universal stress protein [Phycicoccus sp. 3266]|jgi:nucleotide-binding universal stress UspA family protein|uniref:universal stress protein n=1 Tax=Phycicoccus sp. 3266 TaxID=2817751 RepID=UPI00285A020B|nr:universal stress protein [Phycicoccus sp. 3266]MDR6864767.1 nucleotide-binding universal stress UspA family protein [Phycicoccus sp. 3266]
MTIGDAPIVVVGCDGSWASGIATRAAALEAGRRGEDLVVVRVAEHLSARTASGHPAGHTELRDHELVQRAATEAEEADPTVRVETVVAQSLEDPLLSELADRSTLLVLGRRTRGHHPFRPGSTSDALARQFARPVLVPGREDPRPIRTMAYDPGPVLLRPSRVTVGFRPGVDSPRLLAVAAEAAMRRGLSMRVVSCVSTAGRDLEVVQHLVWSVVRGEAWNTVDACDVRVVRGAPEVHLLADVGPSDLLVVGAGPAVRRGGLARGSVLHHVLEDPPCDVLVVQPLADPLARRLVLPPAYPAVAHAG